MIGKPMMLMNKEEKIRALDYLDQKGVFKITKTSLLLCDAMQISKYTLYNYLDLARAENGECNLSTKSLTKSTRIPPASTGGR